MLIDELPRLSDSDRESLDHPAAIEGVPASEPPADHTASHPAIARAQQTEEPADDIRAFLASVRPLRGCSYGNDESFHRGRGAIERIALSLEDAGPAPLVEELGDAVYFVGNIEPIHREHCYACGGGRPACGKDQVMEFIAEQIAEDAKEHVRPIGEAIDEHRREQASRAHNSEDAEEHLTKARALLEVANDLFSQGDGVLIESVTDYMSGYLWTVLEQVRAAQKALARSAAE